MSNDKWEVHVCDRSQRSGLKNTAYEIDTAGAEIRLSDDISIEIYPIDPNAGEITRSRDYDELVRLAALAEKNGGFARSDGPGGPTVTIYDAGEVEAIVTGKDVLTFYEVCWHRAKDLIPDDDNGTDKKAYNQGWNDCLRATQAAHKDAYNKVGRRYD